MKDLPNARKAPMPTAIQPMLATIAEKPFDDPAWIYEIKWDGYRAISYIADGKLRLVSRNQNDMTAQFQELSVMPELSSARKPLSSMARLLHSTNPAAPHSA